MDNIRNITVCISPDLFESLAPAIESACSRLDCYFYLGVPREGTAVLLTVASEGKKPSSMKEAAKAASTLNIPVVEIEASSVSGETQIYELLKPFVKGDNTRSISSLLQMRFPDRIVARSGNTDNNETTPDTGDSEAPREEQPSKGTNTAATILGILLGIAFIIIVVLAANNVEKQDSIEYMDRQLSESQSRYYSLSSSYNTLKDKNDETEKVLKTVSESMPFIITEVEVGNMYKGGTMETDFGRSIYASKTMFITPRVHYYGLKADSYTITIKFHSPSRGTDSYSDTVYLSKGENIVNLSGWGNEKMGIWGKGQYHIDLYYKGKVFYTKYFTIY